MIAAKLAYLQSCCYSLIALYPSIGFVQVGYYKRFQAVYDFFFEDIGGIKDGTGELIQRSSVLQRSSENRQSSDILLGLLGVVLGLRPKPGTPML